MRVARLYSYKNIKIEELPRPEPSKKEAIVRVRASGICSGDVMPWYIEKKAPLVLGHEPAGEIVEVGEGVEGFQIGDRVFIHHHAPCMSCRFCKRGDYVQCPDWRKMGIYPGGISEYIRVSASVLMYDTLKLPDTVGFDDAVLVEPLACVVKSFKRSGIKKGDTVLVLGLGVMGVLHVMVARHYGADIVIGADMVPFRLNKAKELGADETINVADADLREAVETLTQGKGPEIVIAGPNSVKAMEQALDMVSAGGTVVLFTPARPGERLVIDPNSLYFRDIKVVTSYSCGPDDTTEALYLIEKGLVRADRLVTHRYPLEKTDEAYRVVARATDSLKVIIEMN
ncbi:MAG: alcohol dehydrogenase catalytic domain-containing protein [Nitrospirae bacterium]|nr:alcohol dehydrogenase catalytic domain-containing protein [Nitrospirota bacterium]